MFLLKNTCIHGNPSLISCIGDRLNAIVHRHFADLQIYNAHVRIYATDTNKQRETPIYMYIYTYIYDILLCYIHIVHMHAYAHPHKPHANEDERLRQLLKPPVIIRIYITSIYCISVRLVDC